MNSFLIIVNFSIIAIASKQIGRYFAKVRLPLISGFLFTGCALGVRFGATGY
jgi:Kef-type K+ transport system membrane component KefB